jgi:hypothetical protein
MLLHADSVIGAALVRYYSVYANPNGVSVMKIRSIALAIVAVLATSAALAEAPARKPAEPGPTPREQTLVEEISAGMRDILRAVTPEISLPTIEVKLPALDARKGASR